MKFYNELNFAENYLLNFGLEAQKRGVVVTQEMILKNFKHENEVSLNKVLNGLKKHNYVELQFYSKGNSPVNYLSALPYKRFNTFKCIFKDKKTEDK